MTDFLLLIGLETGFYNSLSGRANLRSETKQNDVAKRQAGVIRRADFCAGEKPPPRREDEGVARVQTPAGNVALNSELDSADQIVSAWESIRANLRRDCGARTFDGWLRPIALGGFQL